MRREYCSYIFATACVWFASDTQKRSPMGRMGILPAWLWLHPHYCHPLHVRDTVQLSWECVRRCASDTTLEVWEYVLFSVWNRIWKRKFKALQLYGIWYLNACIHSSMSTFSYLNIELIASALKPSFLRPFYKFNKNWHSEEKKYIFIYLFTYLN